MLMLAYSVAWKSTIRRGQSMPADWPCLVYVLFIPSLYLLYALFMPSMWVWCDMRSSHVMPTLACAMAGIYGCGLQESAHLNMKPDIAYRGVVGSSFQDFGFARRGRLDTLSSSASRRRRWVSPAEVSMPSLFFIEILLFSLDFPSFCIFANKYR